MDYKLSISVPGIGKAGTGCGHHPGAKGTKNMSDAGRDKTNLVNALESHGYSKMLKTVVIHKRESRRGDQSKIAGNRTGQCVRRGL